MTRYLLDTNIIRYYIDPLAPEHLSVRAFFNSCRANGDFLFISMVTKMELESQEVELSAASVRAIRTIIQALRPISINDPNDLRAHRLRRFGKWMKIHHQQTCQMTTAVPKIPALADAQICVTGMVEGLTIVTNNVKDFALARFFGTTIYNPVTQQTFPPIALNKQPPYYWDIVGVAYS